MGEIKTYFKRFIILLTSLGGIGLLYLVLTHYSIISRWFNSVGNLDLLIFLITALTFTAAACAIMQQHKAGIKQEIIGAWQVLANKASGNSGKIESIEFLAKQGKSLQGVDMSIESHKGQVYLQGLNVSKTKLGTKANFRSANFGGVNLSDANFKGAHLSYNNFKGANLRSANFENANLCHANFESAISSGVNFKGVLLYGSKFIRTELGGSAGKKTDFRGSTYFHRIIFRENFIVRSHFISKSCYCELRIINLFLSIYPNDSDDNLFYHKPELKLVWNKCQENNILEEDEAIPAFNNLLDFIHENNHLRDILAIDKHAPYKKTLKAIISVTKELQENNIYPFIFKKSGTFNHEQPEDSLPFTPKGYKFEFDNTSDIKEIPVSEDEEYLTVFIKYPIRLISDHHKKFWWEE